MAEYIEREALRDSVESIDWYSVYRGKLTTGANNENALYKANDIYSAIDNAPAADVAQVVRCKSCVHYDMGVCLKIYSDGNVHTEAWQERKPDDFCSYGEPKNGGAKNAESRY